MLTLLTLRKLSRKSKTLLRPTLKKLGVPAHFINSIVREANVLVEKFSEDGSDSSNSPGGSDPGLDREIQASTRGISTQQVKEILGDAAEEIIQILDGKDVSKEAADSAVALMALTYFCLEFLVVFGPYMDGSDPQFIELVGIGRINKCRGQLSFILKVGLPAVISKLSSNSEFTPQQKQQFNRFLRSLVV